MGASFWFGSSLLVLGGLCAASRSLVMQKVWWIFFGCWIASCFLVSNIEYPATLAVLAGLDFLCMAGFVAVLWGRSFRNTRASLMAIFLTMLSCHAGWAILLHFNLNPWLTSTNYYHQFALNVMTALSYLVIGGRCVPLVLGAYSVRSVSGAWRSSAFGGRE